MFNINILRKIAITTRKSIKLLILIFLAVVVLVGLVVLFYNPTYEVSLNGEVIGFTTNKSELQERINGFTEENEEENEPGRRAGCDPDQCSRADGVVHHHCAA